MERLFRLLGIVVAYCACTEAFADPDPNLNKTDQVPNTQVRYGSIITPHNPTDLHENDKISGTYIEVTANLSLTGGGIAPDPQTKLVKVELIMGGQTFEIHRGDGVETTTSIPGRFRFATTLGADGSDIQIRVRAVFIMQPSGYSSPAEFPTDQTYTFKAYNKLHVLGTTVDSNGGEDLDHMTISGYVASAARNNLTTHTSIPSGYDIFEEKSELIERFKPATFACILTHGTRQYICDSFGSPGSGDENKAFFESEVADGVYEKLGDRIPPYNICVMYACSTLEETVHSVGAYGVNSAGRGYCGFEKPVALRLWSMETWNEQDWELYPTEPWDNTLSGHADILFYTLNQGLPLTDAVFDANNALPPVTPITDRQGEIIGFERELMDIDEETDQFARIKYVYLSGTEYVYRQNNSLPLNVWWININ